MTELLYFTADFCGVCEQQKPIIEELKEESDLIVETVDAEENKELANQYNVRSLPQIIIKRNGHVKQKFTGLTQKNEIVEVAT